MAAGEALDVIGRWLGKKEDTMHLMFECEKYSEPLWVVVGTY
jgi:hypothetical protein